MKSILIALRNKIKPINKRRFVCSSIFSFLLSIFLVIGHQMNETRMINWHLSTPINIFIMFALIETVTYIFIDKIKYKSDKKYNVKRWQIFLPLFLIAFFVLFACYPGNYNIDITYEWNIYKANSYSTHFPIFYNMVFCGLMDFLHSIFNSWEVAVFILNLAQITIVTLVVSEILFYLSKRIKNKNFTLLLTLYYIINPLFLTLIMSTSHDIGFAVIFALIVLETVKMVENEDYFEKRINWLKFIFLTFMFCIFRNNGLFAIVPALILGLFFMKGKRIKFTAIVTIPLIMFIGYNQLIVNNVVTNKESVFRESLNVPVNQMARALYYNFPRAFSEEQYKYFEVECNWPYYGRYPMITDFQKRCLKTDYIEKHFFEFLAYWAKVGTKAPHRYVEAPFLFWLGAYYPFITYHDPSEDDPTLHGYVSYSIHRNDGNVFLGRIDIDRYPHIKIVDKAMTELITNQKWSKIFFFRVIWGGSFTTILLIFTACYVALKKQKKYFLPLCFIFGMLLTVLLSPVVLYRYMFPIVLSVPIMFYVILKCSEGKKREKTK